MVEIDDLLRFPSRRHVLTALDVHICYVSLLQPLLTFEQLKSLLSRDELARASRFLIEADRRHYICARGILRVLLGSYLTIEPQKVKLGYGSYGKPYVDNRPQEIELSFNLSHSNGFALYAFSLGSCVGVDIEYIRDVTNRDLLVKKFFSEIEQGAYYKLPRHEQQESFFRTWTRKEAYLKATGLGLKKLLCQVEVPVSPHPQTALLRVIDDSYLPSEMSLHDLLAPPGYVAAIVTEGTNFQPTFINDQVISW